ncbi:MAG: phosphomannomutase/phosphoglucomutase, partial [Thermoleophilia bacterium]|nr:phosphomannomutase/phosphoglucomutase [Thermoleophilia bacterium]
MTFDPSSVKAYDIRGIYPDQIDAEGAYLLGRAWAAFLEPVKAAVGRDMRTMAPEIAEALINGLCDSGVDVIDIGMVPTEVLYHAVASRELDGGIMVTASHNPKEYIGMKVVRRGAQPMGLDSGLDKVRDLALKGDFPIVETKGTVERVDIMPSFYDKVRSIVDTSKIRNLNIVVDAGNGIGGTAAMPLLEQLENVNIHAYNIEPDGTFPNHEPNPLLPENRQFIIDRVIEHKADLGIAWDGDADRCFFIDGTGEFVPGDFITALLAEYELRSHPGAKILYDVRASRAVADKIEAAGGIALRSRVGHAFIKQRMKREQAAFAGEVSGHYYFADFHGVDTGMIPALIMLQLVSEAGVSLADLLVDMRAHYFLSGEINSTVDDVP